MTTEFRDTLQDALGSSYTITRELGGGGMSRVFVAREESLRRNVVVKVLPRELTGGVLGSHYADIFAFMALVLVLTLRPQGLLPERRPQGMEKPLTAPQPRRPPAAAGRATVGP